MLRRIKGEACFRTGRLDDPDVPAGRLVTMDGDPLHVGRHFDTAVDARRAGPLHHLAGGAGPREVPFCGIRLRADVPRRTTVLEVGEHATRRHREVSAAIALPEADFISHASRLSRQRQCLQVERLRIDRFAAVKQEMAGA